MRLWRFMLTLVTPLQIAGVETKGNTFIMGSLRILGRSYFP